MSVEANCTLLVLGPDRAVSSASELQTELESPDAQRKVAALKKAIAMLLSGEDAPRMLMTVIRYCITVEDHTLQVRCRQSRNACLSSARLSLCVRMSTRSQESVVPQLVVLVASGACCCVR